MIEAAGMWRILVRAWPESVELCIRPCCSHRQWVSNSRIWVQSMWCWQAETVKRQGLEAALFTLQSPVSILTHSRLYSTHSIYYIDIISPCCFWLCPIWACLLLFSPFTQVPLALSLLHLILFNIAMEDLWSWSSHLALVFIKLSRRNVLAVKIWSNWEIKFYYSKTTLWAR